MRRILIIPALAAAAVAAGCGERRDPAAAGGNEAAAAVAPEPAGPAAPAPVAQVATAEPDIPAAMHGGYDASPEACGRPSDARLTVSATQLRFHESIGTVRKVASIGAGAVSLEADYQGEGERWRSVRELRLGDGGNQLTISGDGTRLARVRCPAEAR